MPTVVMPPSRSSWSFYNQSLVHVKELIFISGFKEGSKEKETNVILKIRTCQPTTCPPEMMVRSSARVPRTTSLTPSTYSSGKVPCIMREVGEAEIGIHRPQCWSQFSPGTTHVTMGRLLPPISTSENSFPLPDPHSLTYTSTPPFLLNSQWYTQTTHTSSAHLPN